MRDIESGEHRPILPQPQKGWLEGIDQIDRSMSNLIHNRISHNVVMDYVILCFGLLFNRAGCALTVLISGFIAMYNPGRMPSVGNGKHYNEAALYMVVNILAILTLLIITQTLKKTIKRPRPHNGEGCPMRAFDIAVKEVGTFAMPSGDTAQGALCFTLT